MATLDYGESATAVAAHRRRTITPERSVFDGRRVPSLVEPWPGIREEKSNRVRGLLVLPR
ncbi:hypothetical protein EA472_05040 [Natrarchaeobius oligotrophus]|uniref:Uncharacterized protein n=1 Tax=Natrarchaeobius chitinivorans TaxID=1679083 RepID=A0A3N6MM91_NATCH|nr:hypothetical protein EA472_05040 [Natrarchaeobius chitinivorans]